MDRPVSGHWVDLSLNGQRTDMREDSGERNLSVDSGDI